MVIYTHKSKMASDIKYKINKEGGHLMLTLKQAKKGFTIIELLIVIAIIVILAGLVLTNVQGAQSKARDSQRLSDINSMFTALEAQHGDDNFYPEEFTALDGAEEGALNDPRGGDTVEMIDTSSLATDDQAGARAAVIAAATGDAEGESGYAYAPFGCADGECTGYAIGTYTENPQDDGNNYYVKVSLNQ